ncbi:MAG: hypothetical protein WHS65_07160 [Melioribacteraceae bacterium]
MRKSKLPIPIHQLAMLQVYLYEILSIDKKCEKNFKHTEWYMNENFSKNEIEKILKFFQEEDVHCNCGILKKINLQNYIDESIKYHD